MARNTATQNPLSRSRPVDAGTLHCLGAGRVILPANGLLSEGARIALCVALPSLASVFFADSAMCHSLGWPSVISLRNGLLGGATSGPLGTAVVTSSRSGLRDGGMVDSRGVRDGGSFGLGIRGDGGHTGVGVAGVACCCSCIPLPWSWRHLVHCPDSGSTLPPHPGRWQMYF